VRPEDAPPHEPEAPREAPEEHPLVLRLPVGTRLADAERKLILLTLDAVRGNKQRAARVLGISRRGLYSKLQSYGEHVGAQEAPEAPESDTPAEAEPPGDVEGAAGEAPAARDEPAGAGDAAADPGVAADGDASVGDEAAPLEAAVGGEATSGDGEIAAASREG
jgi:hypothetical protein